MLLRRYGANVQSVETNFDASALNEVSFRRDQKHSLVAETFEREWKLVDERVLSAQGEGPVHSEVEVEVLRDLAGQLDSCLSELGPGEAWLIRNEPGIDWPRSRQHSRTVVEAGSNRLHFTVSIDPPLRLERYRRTDGD